MDFDFSPAEEAFREELREFLRQELPDWWRGRFNDDPASFELVKRVAPKMAARGWLTMHWPPEYGGRDASMWEQVVLREEVAIRAEPRGSNYMATNWAGPSIMLFGTEEQKREHLPKIAQGQRWCQGFSEPNAGSDLAALRTRAVRVGDEYVINGQKIWTSHTPSAEMMFLVVRSDPNAPKHKGISVFLLPLDTPGIRVVQIRAMNGTIGEFAEVFFDDVRVPDTWRLGPENEGWRVAIEALAFERLGVPRWRVAVSRLGALREYARQTRADGSPQTRADGSPQTRADGSPQTRADGSPQTRADGSRLYDDPAIRQRFAQLATECETAKLMYYRNVSEEVSGADTTLIVAMSRVLGTRCTQRVGDFAMELLGGLADVDQEDLDWVPLRAMASEWWMFGITATIAAGTTEINKNNIATRGLGLPRV